MTGEELLTYLRELDIRLFVKGDRLICNAPGGRLTPEIRADLANRKAEIIHLLKQEAQEPKVLDLISKVPRDRSLPLSFAQQRLYFLHKLEPKSPVYNLTASRFIKGEIDVRCLELSICKLVERHEILRTVFREINGTPVQVITDEKASMTMVDLGHLAVDSRKDEFRRWRQAEAIRPFTTDTPMFRASLVRLSDEEHYLIFVMHHIISDGWSLGIIFRELGEVYESCLIGRPATLPNLPFQYGDYALWQRENFQGAAAGRHAEYWLKKLGGNLPVLDLPTDRQRGPLQSSNGAVKTFRFSAELSAGLRALSRQSGVSLFMVLLATFKILLHRYTAQSDVIVGTPVANRSRPELESLIGLFVNTLVLRTDLTGDPTARELIARIREVVLEAHEHQELPFEKIVELTRPDRDLAQSPLFQVAFILQNTPGSLEYDTVSAGAMFDLSLFFWEREHDITGSFEYNSGLFEERTIARMIGHIETLAKAVAKNPDERISKLPILTEAEEAQFIEWNQTATDYPRNLTIHELFRAQASATPNSVALVFPRSERHSRDLELTYREIDSLANRLARRLRSLGVGPEVRVGLAMDRSPDLIVAILAILKAGGAYVPIDLAYPRDRCALMVEDAEIKLLLTTAELLEKLPETRARILCLDQDRQEIAFESESSLDCSAGAESLAYVMYTSGSTGRPKGVCVTHRNVIRLVKNTNYVSLSPQEVLLACAPVSFDASTFEIWGSLLNGGRLVLYPDRVPTPQDIARRVREYGVTTLWLTAGLFHLMVETQSGCLSKVRQLLAGGDILSPAHVSKALEALQNGVLINGYGPTENTTFTTCYRVEPVTDAFHGVPIGRPISNTQVYVLDSSMGPVPVGVRGELWTGGDGVARGYLNADELTDTKFVPDPFKGDVGARLYRTGDFVRFRPDGNLEFLGRVDNQLKIRGFRVEPAEVEQVLSQHPGLREAAVVARDYNFGSKYLAAYVVPDLRPGPAVDDLRRFMTERLPAYMVPSSWITLDDLPLTPNGKVDYGNLPDLSERQLAAATPRTMLETQLIAIWENVLGVSGIGLKDNFFDLGGHSLLALRLLTQLEKVFSRPFPLSTVFQAQTIEEMAAVLIEDSLEFGGSLVAIQTGGSMPPLFLIPGVGGSALGYGELSRLLGADQPVYCLQSLGLDGNQDPLYRIEDIGSHFVSEIRKIQPNKPYHLVGFCMGGAVAFEIAQQLTAEGQGVATLALIETWPPTYAPGTSGVPSVLRPFVFVSRGILRQLRSFKGVSPNQLLAHLKKKSRMVKEMVKMRDVYRGDRSEFYRDLVQNVNLRAFSRYSPRSYKGAILLFTAINRELRGEDDPRLYWGRLAERGYKTFQLPGEDSGSLLKKPYVQELAGLLAGHLGNTEARS